jgi:molybdate transport system substrate-binding protein
MPKTSEAIITRARASALLFGCAALLLDRGPVLAQSDGSIKLIYPIPVTALLDALVPIYERVSSRKIISHFDPTAARTIAAGEAFDVAVIGVTNMDGLIKAGAVVADSKTVIGTAVAELAYKRSVARPDISTPESLKAVLLNRR